MIAQIAHRKQCAHLSPKIQSVQGVFFLGADSLPYEKLGGHGFERLCYLLLLTLGYSPLFFGDSGQADRGIDLLVDEDGERVVYQCKNEKRFSVSDMVATLEKFELEWLQQTDLPKPRKFVLCLTRSLSNVKDLELWEKYREEFVLKHQIEVGAPWDRNYLNETLKQSPDVVAEIFSDQIAELFCERDDWDFDQFHPVVASATEPLLKRYFDRKTTNRLYLDSQRGSEFIEKLESSGSVLIKGLPGSGKTVTSLALTDELDGYRVYYISLRDNISNDTLVRGVRDRLSRRTIFLLDDCQGKFTQLDSLMIRLRRLLNGRPPNQALFVFLARTTATPDDLARGDEITGFEEDLKQSDSVLNFAPDPQVFRNIVERSKPEFDDITPERLVKLYEFTGHDLFLLDQLLDTLHALEELDDLNLDSLLRNTIVRYFGSAAVARPGFMHLAALAQFDLAPVTIEFPYDLKAEDPRAMIELVAEAGHPLQYFFLHSSAAELVFRALAVSHGITDHIGSVVDHLIRFFKERGPDELTLPGDLAKVIRNSPTLLDGTEQARLKSAFLSNNTIFELIEHNFVRLPLNLLAVCRTVLRNTNSTARDRYQDLIQRKIEDGSVLQAATTQLFFDCSVFLQSIKRAYPHLLFVLRHQLAANGLRSLAQTTELQNFLGLVSIVAEPQSADWHNWLELIPDDEIQMMFERTITNGRSIGTLSATLRELKKSDEPLLRRLEEKISAPRWVRMIAANGTLFELLNVIQSSTPELAEEMIAVLDDNLVEELIMQTITSGRSIGTLNFTLRELKNNDEALLRRVEEKISAPHWLRLIAAKGTVFELFRITQYCTLELAKELIAALDDQYVDQLIAQTITSGRSIGTLSFTLRELKRRDEDLLRCLEEPISVPRWLRLISANGTLFELFSVIRTSTLELAEEMIAALDDNLVEQLIAQTITRSRSIATLELALRELKKSDKALLRRLEEKLGAPRWLRLIAANGTLNELFGVIKNSTVELAREMSLALDDKLIEQLIEKTITSGRSIATLGFTLRELKKSDKALLRRLEKQIGTRRWLHLIAANGTLVELFEVIRASTVELAKELIAALDDKLIEQLIAQTIASGRSIGMLHGTFRYLKRANRSLLHSLEMKIGITRLWRLISSFGSITILVTLVPALDRSTQQEFIQAARRLSAEEWQQLLRKNGFRGIGYLVNNLPWFFSDKFRPDFLRPILVTLIQSSDWESRNSGWLNLSKAPDSIGKRYLLKLLDEQLSGIEPATLKFRSFSEAAHALNLLRRVMPTRLDELTDAFWRFISTARPVYLDPNYLQSARNLLSAFATPKARPNDARGVLEICNDARVAKLCAKATALDLSLYLWNLFGLWFQWKDPDEKSFAEFLNVELRVVIPDSFKERLTGGNDRAKTDGLIVLAGAISVIGVSCDRSAEVEEFLSKLPSLDEMVFSLDHRRSFIPSVFFLLGLEWIFEDERGVPPQVWREQLAKADAYPEATAALNHLKTLARTKSQQR